MTTHIWRAIALEELTDEYSGDLVLAPGDTIGRRIGYLSRSSAKWWGEHSGVRYVLVKSDPITFPKPVELELLEAYDRIAELEIKAAYAAVAR